MKNIIKLFTFPLLTIIGFNSCASIPLKIGESENNSTYTVSYLFEHDGCKVYRFYDKGNYVHHHASPPINSNRRLWERGFDQPVAQRKWRRQTRPRIASRLPFQVCPRFFIISHYAKNVKP